MENVGTRAKKRNDGGGGGGGGEKETLARKPHGDRQVGELSVVSYCSELASGELQDLEFSKSCRQDMENSRSCRKDLENSRSCDMQ